MNGIANLGFQTQQPHQSHTQRFIPFSANTTGKCGRPVFIDAKLLPQFLINVDLRSHGGQQVIRGIEMLRSLGGGINAYQSKIKAAKHMSVIGGLEVYYYIAQQDLSANNASGIYITDLSKAPHKTSAAGNYLLKDGIASRHNFLTFDGEQACISAAANIEQAAEDASPHIELDGWGKPPLISLYFIPEALNNQHGTWITPTQKHVKVNELAAELATILETSQKARINAKSPMRIRVFNSATQILSIALDKFNNHLDKLGFELIDPDESAASVLKKLTASNARLSPVAIKTTNRNANFKLTNIRYELAQLLSKSGRGKSANELLNSTAKPAAAIATSRNMLSNNNYFVSAVKQANMLSQWDR